MAQQRQALIAMTEKEKVGVFCCNLLSMQTKICPLTLPADQDTPIRERDDQTADCQLMGKFLKQFRLANPRMESGLPPMHEIRSSPSLGTATPEESRSLEQ